MEGILKDTTTIDALIKEKYEPWKNFRIDIKTETPITEIMIGENVEFTIRQCMQYCGEHDKCSKFHKKICNETIAYNVRLGKK